MTEETKDILTGMNYIIPLEVNGNGLQTLHIGKGLSTNPKTLCGYAKTNTWKLWTKLSTIRGVLQPICVSCQVIYRMKKAKS